MYDQLDWALSPVYSQSATVLLELVLLGSIFSYKQLLVPVVSLIKDDSYLGDRRVWLSSHCS
jgi:hypothetical protein